jgi:hypothetical protein
LQDEGDQEAAALLNHLASKLASLEHPSQGVAAVVDTERMAAYSSALRAAVAEKGPSK